MSAETKVCERCKGKGRLYHRNPFAYIDLALRLVKKLEEFIPRPCPDCNGELPPFVQHSADMVVHVDSPDFDEFEEDLDDDDFDDFIESE